MGFYLTTILVLLGLIGGILTGLMSVGGGLMIIFLLLFVPPWLGTTYTMHSITGMVMILTLFSASSGLYSYWKNKWVNMFLLKYMGSSSLIGGVIGAMIANSLSSAWLTGLFAILSFIAVIVMILPDPHELQPTKRRPWLAILCGVSVGLLGGMFGLGAGFLYLPIMLILFRLPIKTAIGTGLAMSVLLAIGALTMKATSIDFPWMEGFMLTIGAIPGAQIGARLGAVLPEKTIRICMTIMIVFVCCNIWSDLLQETSELTMSMAWTIVLSSMIGLSLIFVVIRSRLRRKREPA